jgi:glycosyltransferase involved in cell wall biosynthesis/SAM-dependent methyltransferase
VPVDEQAVEAAAEVLGRRRIGVFIVAFQAERFIARVLERIPAGLRDGFAEILVIDDSSSDQTVDEAQAAADRLRGANVTVLRTPFNRGYGGNQKLGYLHAIKQGFEYVVLLHGDGQYAPELLPEIVLALDREQPDALIASRMIHRRDALRGGMPLYKWLGNQVLTVIENRALGSRLSEFHSGYRAYRVDALRSIPFELDSDEFHFDTEILVQLLRTGRKVVEIPAPTFYGEEISRVNGIRYAVNCLKAVAKARLAEVGLFYEPKFDFGVFDEKGYVVKEAPNSLHQDILGLGWQRDWQVADLGANRGVLSARLAERVAHVTAVDLEAPREAGAAEALALDLDGPFDETLGRRRFDAVLALDVIEHLKRPEEGVRRIAEILKPGGMLYASTGNVAYAPMRLSLALGQFNYGKRGILDLTHTRLFTVYSFRRLLAQAGFAVVEVKGFGPPIRDMVGEGGVLGRLDTASGALARAWPRLFAFNFLVVARRLDELEDVYARTLSPPPADG